VKTVEFVSDPFSPRKILDQPVFVWAMAAFLAAEEVAFSFPEEPMAETARAAFPEAAVCVGQEGDLKIPACVMTVRGAALLLSDRDPGADVRFIADEGGFVVAQQFALRSVALRHLQNGVEIADTASVYISPLAKIGEGTVLLPGTILSGACEIGAGCTVGPNSYLKNCAIGDRTTVASSDLTDSVFGADCEVGPFAYVRPGCRVGDRAKVGDFVELKNTVIGDDTKLSHLTYAGDSDLGRNVNVGCGVVVVNYDGAKKTRTTVGDNAFVGCNTNLISPVNVGDRAYIAAGSTITEDVPADALAIARSRQSVKPGGAKGRFTKVKKYE